MIASTRAHVKTSFLSQPLTSKPSRKAVPGLYSESLFTLTRRDLASSKDDDDDNEVKENQPFSGLRSTTEFS